MKENKVVKKGLDIINKHKGKRITYNTYMKVAPDVAEKYLEFICRNRSAQYIRWDMKNERFTS